jgi:hypothetical protein
MMIAEVCRLFAIGFESDLGPVVLFPVPGD